MAADSPAVAVEGLVVKRGPVTAVAGIDFIVQRGATTLLLGPNGAGKTSTIEHLEGYLPRSAGSAAIFGIDPQHGWARLAPRVGLMLQQGGIPTAIRPTELLRQYASFFENPMPVGELLELVGLNDRGRTPYRRLSGGEQQRLSLALALVGRPQLLFLDEPTAGVDLEGRDLIRNLIKGLARDGTTICMTTHDLAEAEQLADKVLIIDHGRIVADGTPAELMATAENEHVSFAAVAGLDVADMAAAVGADIRELAPGEYRVDAAPTPDVVAAVTNWLALHDLPIGDLRAGRKSLEDVFRRLTQDPTDGESLEGEPREDREVNPYLGQLRTELTLSSRQGEQLLVSLGIPLLVLVFFSSIDVLPTGTDEPVDYLAPAVLALAVMSTAMVSLGIGTGFERQYGVLKRLGASPLGRPRWVAAKITTVCATEVLQWVVLVAVAVLIGWSPPGSGWLPAVGGALLGTLAFGGLGLLMAGTLPGLGTLALANGLYIVLLLTGGMIVPLDELPSGVAAVARVLPAAPLTEVITGSLVDGVTVGGWAWISLALWAVAAPAAAAALFRWEA